MLQVSRDKNEYAHRNGEEGEEEPALWPRIRDTSREGEREGKSVNTIDGIIKNQIEQSKYNNKTLALNNIPGIPGYIQ